MMLKGQSNNNGLEYASDGRGIVTSIINEKSVEMSFHFQSWNLKAGSVMTSPLPTMDKQTKQHNAVGRPAACR